MSGKGIASRKNHSDAASVKRLFSANDRCWQRLQVIVDGVCEQSDLRLWTRLFQRHVDRCSARIGASMGDKLDATTARHGHALAAAGLS